MVAGERAPDEKRRGDVPGPGRPHTPSTGDLLGDGEAKPWSSQGSTGGTTPEEADALAGMMSVTTVPIRKLGSGGQADVLLVEHLGQLEAHKVLRVGRGNEREVFREALHTRRVSHPNIVKVFGIEKVGDVPVLRMEYVEGKDLGRVVDEEGAFPVEKLVPLAVQVADALAATHEREIVHHDLKPGNLILRKDGRTVVVTDFGVSAALRTGDDGSKKAGRGGTPYFMAPELHQPGGHGTIESDIWSLGVTLYYLASGIYPFPFGDTSPAEAVKKPPRDLLRTHRQVPPEFWAIVRRMLRDDPSGARYASMKEVRDDLDACVRSIGCPDCGGVFRLESVAAACPEPSCRSTRIVSAVEARTLRRSAETALACCDFDAAKRGFEAAAAVCASSGAVEEGDRLSNIVQAVDQLRAEHDKLLSEVRDLFAKERDIDCVRRIHAARVRFSRSPALKALRLEVRGRIHELFLGTEKLVMESVRRQDFRAARDVLTRMDHIMGDPFARSELAQAAGERSADFQWLYQEVEKKELAFNSYSTRAREKIEAFDFAKAQREYARLETEFPSEHNVRMLAALRDAAARFEAATGVPDDELQAIADDPSRLASDGPALRLAAAAQGCAELLADFPVETYPSYERVRRTGQLVERASAAVRRAVDDRVAAADRARAGGALVDESARLLEALSIVTRTDLFEARVRDEIEARARALRSQAKKVESLYADAESALRANEYARAHAALAELASLVPGGYRDSAGLRADVDRLRGEVSALKEQLAREFAEIERGRFNLETATAALRHAEKLFGLSDGVTRRAQLAELGGVAVRLVQSQTDFLKAAGDVSDDGVVAFLRDSFVPIARALPDERWTALAGASAELCRALCALFDAAARRVLPGADTSVTLLRVDALAEVALSVRALLAAVVAPAGSTHPALRIGQAASDAVADASRHDLEGAAVRALAAFESLGACCPPVSAEALRELAVGVTRAQGAAARARRLARTARIAGWAVPTALAVIGALWGGYIWGEQSAEGGGERIVETALDELVPDGALRGLVADWASGGGASSAFVPRAAFVAHWTTLRADLATLADATSEAGARERAARRAAAAVPGLVVERRAFVESWREPLRTAFDADLRAAVEASVQRALGRAIADGRLARPGDAPLATLRAELAALSDDLQRAGEPASPAGAALRVFVTHLEGALGVASAAVDAARSERPDMAARLAEARVAASRHLDDIPQADRASMSAAAWDGLRTLVALVLRDAAREALWTEVRRAAVGDPSGFAERVRAIMVETRALGTDLPSVTGLAIEGAEALVIRAVDVLTSAIEPR